ncbi:MAG: DUF4349 domain-containing protein [Lentisphaeraceae bacterium]|nr:DUF4349 domain-containing protein [Lentisphaeraceae bacterium]
MNGKVIIVIALLGFGCQSYKAPISGAASKSSEAVLVPGNALVADSVATPPFVPESKKEKAPERELIYEGEASLVTDDIPETSKTIRQECKDLGGYLFSMGSTRLDLRLPARHLESFIAGLEKYGKVKSSNIQADDVTDKHFDFQVRINNAEKLRQRLLELSAKTKNVKEALQLENELARVTAELESLKGFLKRSSQQVKFSKLVIDLSSPEPIKKSPVRLPFNWVNNLAQNLKNPYTPNPKTGGWFTKKIEADLPGAFAAFYNYQNNYWAMNGQGGFYHIQIVDNQVPDAAMEFWRQTLLKFLKEGKLMNVLSSKFVNSKSGKGFQISASYGSGKDSLTYVVQVVPGEDSILVSEIWGVKGEVTANTELLQEVMKNVEASL